MNIQFQQYKDSRLQVSLRKGDLRDDVIIALWETGEKLAQQRNDAQRQLDAALLANAKLNSHIEELATRQAAGVKLAGSALDKFML